MVTVTSIRWIKIFGHTFMWTKRTRPVKGRRSTFVAGGEWR
jgi:hypothetical protein